MYIIIEGDSKPVTRLEVALKRKLGWTKPSFENTNESFKTLWEDLVDGEGIVINHAISRLIHNTNHKDFMRAEACLRKSKAKSLFLVAVESMESPYLLTLNSRIEADMYFVINEEYDNLDHDIDEVVKRFNELKEALNEI